MLPLRPVARAVAWTVLWAATWSSYARVLSAIVPLSDGQCTVLHRVLQCVIAVALVAEINSILNAYAENRWSFKSDRDSWHWEKEVAVVTGGSNGIGAAITKQLTAYGIKVAVLDVEPLSAPLASDANKLITFYQCDITSPDAVHKAAESVRADHGSPSILINNAGIGNSSTILNLSPKLLQRCMNVNLLSNWYTVQEFLPDMIARRKGHVMATASMASFVGPAGSADYAATKAGLMAFHETLTQELKHRYNCPQIKTSIAYPIWTQTRMTDTLDDKFRKSLKRPEDVASAMVNQIIAAKSGSLLLGPTLAPAVRAFPMWIQELVRDAQAHIVTAQATTAVG